MSEASKVRMGGALDPKSLEHASRFRLGKEVDVLDEDGTKVTGVITGAWLLHIPANLDSQSGGR